MSNGTQTAMDSTRPEVHSYLAGMALTCPPSAILYIGVGDDEAGFLPIFIPMSIPILAVDGDEEVLSTLRTRMREHHNIRLKEAVLGGHRGDGIFYRYRPKTESGLVGPSEMGQFWRNLRCVGQDQVSLRVLTDLVSEVSREDAPPGGRLWLIIDCLAADVILEGAARALGHFAVIILRDALHSRDDPHLPANQYQSLTESGFHRVCSVVARLPTLSRHIYVRNFYEQNLRAETRIANLEASIGALQSELDFTANVAMDVHALEERNQELQATLISREELLRNAEDAAARLGRDLVQLAERESQLSATCQRMEDELNRLEGEKVKAAEANERLEHDVIVCRELSAQNLSLWTARISALEEQCERAIEHAEEKQALVGERERLVRLLNESREELVARDARIAAMAADAARAASEALLVDDQRERDQRTRREAIEARMLELEAMNRELDTAREALQKAVEAARQEIKRLNERCAELERNCSLLTTDAKGLTSLLTDAETKRREEEVRTLREVAARDQQISRLQHELTESNQRSAALHETLNARSKLAEELNILLSTMTSERDSAFTDLSRANDALEGNQRDLDALKHQLLSAQGRIGALQMEILKAQTQMQLLVQSHFSDV